MFPIVCTTGSCPAAYDLFTHVNGEGFFPETENLPFEFFTVPVAGVCGLPGLRLITIESLSQLTKGTLRGLSTFVFGILHICLVT